VKKNDLHDPGEVIADYPFADRAVSYGCGMSRDNAVKSRNEAKDPTKLSRTKLSRIRRDIMKINK